MTVSESSKSALNHLPTVPLVFRSINNSPFILFVAKNSYCNKYTSLLFKNTSFWLNLASTIQKNNNNINFLVRDSNPGRQGENLVSWPTRLTRSYLYVTNCQIYIYFTGACNIFKRVPQLFSQTPYKNKIRAPRIELGTYCVLSSRHNQLDQARTSNI